MAELTRGGLCPDLPRTITKTSDHGKSKRALAGHRDKGKTELIRSGNTRPANLRKIPDSAGRVVCQTMRFYITSISLPWIGIGWQVEKGNKEVAKETIIELEGHRVLYGDKYREQEEEALASVNRIRVFLTSRINTAHGNELERSLRQMRAACINFAEAAGHKAQRFRQPENGKDYELELGTLRALIGVQIAKLAGKYKLTVEEGLSTILPPDDKLAEQLPRGSAPASPADPAGD